MKKFFKKINKDHLFWGLLVGYIIGISILAIFRDMVNDEALYFQETFLISELFKAGKWIGAYGVGLHGFLFKIPPALVFMITGPSVTVVTIYHIILTGIVGVLAYRLFSYVLKNKMYGILATAILFSNFHFVLSSVTYLREIPSILVILLVLDNIIRKNNKYVLSLLFLLLLDVKEYIFFIFAVFYVLWLFIDSDEKNIWRRIALVIKRTLIVFLPSFVWIALMFTTHIIPVNMFLASILGLKGNRFRYLTMHLNPKLSTTNGIENGGEISTLQRRERAPGESTILDNFINTLIPYINIFISYIGKVLYPRVSSFLSVPKVVILPVIISSFITIKAFILKKRQTLRNFALLSTLILVWLVVYIVRVSHGRYLLPIVPAIAVIYIYLLFKQNFSKKQRIIISVTTFIYVTAGFLFEVSYLVPKILLEYSILGLFIWSLFRPKLKGLKYLTIGLLVTGSVASAVLFSYVQGQLSGYRTFGVNKNAYQIAQDLPEDEKYWINSVKNYALISSYNKETYLNPEWEWVLHEVVPIKNTLKVFTERRSYSFPARPIELFKETVFEVDIKSVYLIVVDSDIESFLYQEHLSDFQEADWLSLRSVVDFKNMQLYIFDVIE